jgi:hypothetical protein
MVQPKYVVLLPSPTLLPSPLPLPFEMPALLMPLLLVMVVQVMVDLGRSQSGRSSLSRALRLCPAVNLGSMADVLELRGWLASAW